MKLQNKFLSATMAFPIALGGLMVSCEDTCNTCNCDNFKIEYIASADSIDKPLGELYANQTVVIKGTGLSATKEVYLIGLKGTPYSVTLNPAYVTENNVIVTLESGADLVSTDRILLKSVSGCQAFFNITKPVASPSIKMFYSEFVPDGGVLRVAGNAFLSTPSDPLNVWFERVDIQGTPTGEKFPLAANQYKVTHNETELLITVPAGLGENLKLAVSNSHGTVYSSMLFRDTRNVFMNFDTDESNAGDESGSLQQYLAGSCETLKWRESLYAGKATDLDAIMTTIGGQFPEGCSGLYSALTFSDQNCTMSNDALINYDPYTLFPDKPKKNLMGPWENQDLEGLVLKFEMYVPKTLPWYSHAYIVFTPWGSRDQVKIAEFWGIKKKDAPAGRFGRDYTSNDFFGLSGEGDSYEKITDENEVLIGIDCKKSVGCPAAWFHPGKYNIDYDGGKASVVEGFSTDGWMTVAIPLTSGDAGYFRFNPLEKNISTDYKVGKHCGPLDKEFMYTFFFHFDDTSSAQKKGYGSQNVFLALDNFRIVPEDNGGARFSVADGITSGSKYPYELEKK